MEAMFMYMQRCRLIHTRIFSTYVTWTPDLFYIGSCSYSWSPMKSRELKLSSFACWPHSKSVLHLVSDALLLCLLLPATMHLWPAPRSAALCLIHLWINKWSLHWELPHVDPPPPPFFWFCFFGSAPYLNSFVSAPLLFLFSNTLSQSPRSVNIDLQTTLTQTTNLTCVFLSRANGKRSVPASFFVPYNLFVHLFLLQHSLYIQMPWQLPYDCSSHIEPQIWTINKSLQQERDREICET